MKITVHQPNYIPWLGFFHRLSLSDLYVVYDNVQYIQGAVINRNKIRTSDGWQWLTVPVLVKGKLYQKINETKINNSEKWQKRQWNTILQFYQKTEHFNKYADDIQNIIVKTQWDKLIDLNIAFMKYFLEILSIDTKIVFSSELPIILEEGNKMDNLINICNTVEATHLLTGFGTDYFEKDKFIKNNIQHHELEYNHPSYTQRYNEFISHLSILDLIFNYGVDSRKILLSNNITSI